MLTSPELISQTALGILEKPISPTWPGGYWGHWAFWTILLLLFDLLMVMGFIWLERRWIARIQIRRGPNRAGPWGLLQPIADAVKILLKEDIIPERADKWVHFVAPLVAFATTAFIFVVVPFQEGAGLVPDLNVGILYVLAIGILSLLAIFMAGWGSANKFSLVASLRAVAQIISYEIPLMLAIVGVVMVSSSLSLQEIVRQQPVPFAFLLPLSFLIFFIGSLAEIQRTPMDLLEAESELVTGYHIEYSGMKFALFYLAEYTEALIVAILTTILFLSGWKGPLLPPFLWFLIKVFLVFMLIVWFRGTFPRLRVDQLMGFSWKFLLPLAVVNLFLIGAELIAIPSFPGWLALLNLVIAGLLVICWAKLFKFGFGKGVLKGLAVTLHHSLRGAITIQYPEEKIITSKRIRGNELIRDGVKCTGCAACAESCPQGVIELVTSGVKEIVTPPCNQACPAGVDIPRYIRFIAEGKTEAAIAVVREKIPFPAVCGRVCGFCEAKCRRGERDEPVSIRALKRFAADHDTGIWKSRLKFSPSTGKKVAIVGSGPAGLTAAYYLAKCGHSVTIFEKLPEPGGMLRVGIPDYRLPKDILQVEIEEIKNLGVDIRTNMVIDSLEELFEQGYNAVFLALGAHQGTSLGVKGEDDPRVMECISFLREVNLGKEVRIGRRLAVIGGGNAAIDSARTALRLGAEKVTILYRRTRVEMPASPEEVEAALDEGIKIEFLVAPTNIMSQDGELKLECIRMKLGAPDASGRRRPEPIKGSEFILSFDNIIVAIGQRPEIPRSFSLTTGRGNTIQVAPDTLATSREGVFAGGDAVSGPALVIEAIAAGRKGAIAIDKYLGGTGDIEETLAPPASPIREAGEWGRAQIPLLSVDRRINNFTEVELEMSPEAAIEEAKRCLRCDLAYELEVFGMDTGCCIFCGLCVEACPENALFMGYSYERARYQREELKKSKDDLLPSADRKPSGYARPEIEKQLSEQNLLVYHKKRPWGFQ